MQVGELIVMRGDADGVLTQMTSLHDPHNGGDLFREISGNTLFQNPSHINAYKFSGGQMMDPAMMMTRIRIISLIAIQL